MIALADPLRELIITAPLAFVFGVIVGYLAHRRYLIQITRRDRKESD